MTLPRTDPLRAAGAEVRDEGGVTASVDAVDCGGEVTVEVGPDIDGEVDVEDEVAELVWTAETGDGRDDGAEPAEPADRPQAAAHRATKPTPHTTRTHLTG
jgi:hypothetical protein